VQRKLPDNATLLYQAMVSLNMEFFKKVYIGTSWAPLAIFLGVRFFSSDLVHDKFGNLMLLAYLSYLMLIVGFCLLVHSNNRKQKLSGILLAMFMWASWFWAVKI
jgi:uncharacterized membrane protein